MTAETERELGPQPLDALLTRLGLSNSDLVRSSKNQLSFKVVQKARKGRRLTLHSQKKILIALLAAHPGSAFTLPELFNY